MKKRPNKNSGKWFIRVRGSYLPNSWQGWLTYIPFVGYLILGFAIAIRDENSVGAIIYSLVPQWIAAAVVMTWVAQRKS